MGECLVPPLQSRLPTYPVILREAQRSQRIYRTWLRFSVKSVPRSLHALRSVGMTGALGFPVTACYESPQCSARTCPRSRMCTISRGQKNPRQMILPGILHEIQLEGKSKMSVKDFMNGAGKNYIGMKFEKTM